MQTVREYLLRSDLRTYSTAHLSHHALRSTVNIYQQALPITRWSHSENSIATDYYLTQLSPFALIPFMADAHSGFCPLPPGKKLKMLSTNLSAFSHSEESGMGLTLIYVSLYNP